MLRPRRRSRPPELLAEPFDDACLPAGAGDLPDRAAGLVPADAVPGGFFPGCWPEAGFCVFLPGAGLAVDAAGLAVAAGLAEPTGLAEAAGLAVPLALALASVAAGFAVADGLPAVDDLPEVTDLVAVSLLTAVGFAGAVGAGEPPAVAVAVPGTVGGYRLNSTYCWPRVHTFVVTQYRTRPNAQYRPDSAKNGTM